MCQVMCELRPPRVIIESKYQQKEMISWFKLYWIGNVTIWITFSSMAVAVSEVVKISISVAASGKKIHQNENISVSVYKLMDCLWNGNNIPYEIIQSSRKLSSCLFSWAPILHWSVCMSRTSDYEVISGLGHISNVWLTILHKLPLMI